jgi:GNAT superfamily N-acetyltransferase
MALEPMGWPSSPDDPGTPKTPKDHYGHRVTQGTLCSSSWNSTRSGSVCTHVQGSEPDGQGSALTDPHVSDRDEIEPVTATLAEAFHNDPVWTWAIPDASHRRRRFGCLWSLLITSAVESSWVWSTAEAGAVALWNPPGVPDLVSPYDEEVDEVIDRQFGSSAERLRSVLAAFDQHRPTSPEHFYLNMFGVRDDQRGKGLGMKLLALNPEAIDALGQAAYLESSNPANNKRYLAHGFEILEEFSLPEGGPTVTTMCRDAPQVPSH